MSNVFAFVLHWSSTIYVSSTTKYIDYVQDLPNSIYDISFELVHLVSTIRVCVDFSVNRPLGKSLQAVSCQAVVSKGLIATIWARTLLGRKD